MSACDGDASSDNVVLAQDDGSGVQPHWLVKPDANGRWSMTMQLAPSTKLAEERANRGRQLVGSGA